MNKPTINIMGLIPARGGSKGIPKKNIKVINGKPLIDHTIQQALNSSLLDTVAVTTDSEEIIQSVEHSFSDAVKLGKLTLIERPASLATDSATIIPSVDHALQTLESGSVLFDVIVLLQPTSPLRTHTDIDAAITKLLDSEADTLISVVKVDDAHPQRMYTQSNDRLVPFCNNGEGRIRQELPDVYLRNGAIYATHRKIFDQHQSLMQGAVVAYEMPIDRSANIDNPIDFILAEALLKQQSGLHEE